MKQQSNQKIIYSTCIRRESHCYKGEDGGTNGGSFLHITWKKVHLHEHGKCVSWLNSESNPQSLARWPCVLTT
jgi:hypothetical protein